ncbi:phosphate acetyltransferase [Clostridium cylindrosporum]|uniref:Phosphate acetyltransferase n=1 Tax=Clostridium cylindrosporum DSM 605 TaxID=1121307 RepID=A0A0J8D6J2_CLOCY|nr:phosphate acetyltransferase [Clostridium cylindrosporum]KMT21472.1 phosphate acetyltransferase Pta [Clostridium cylindrosporum DSM 605]
MGLIERIREKAKTEKKTIVLPEGNERRTIKAAQIIQQEGIANIILLGNEVEIKKIAEEEKADLNGIEILDYLNSEKFEKYAEEFYELRKHKGMTIEKARETLKDEIYFGTMMVKDKKADGLVSGAIHSTGDLLRPALQIIKTAKDAKIVSSFFVIEVPNCEYGEDGVFFFSDCGVNTDPNAEELASIALSTAKSAIGLAAIKPKVAMLSFSTMGSAKSPSTEKVIKATEIAKETLPEDVLIDGEIQLDAAIDKNVAKIKAPNSSVAGRANILVFPNLDAGNIGYKLVQRLAKAEAIGPICQGFAAPINDLSRGCNVDDIVSAVAITAVQAMDMSSK